MKKLALVVGHNSVAQGAVRKDTGETEFSMMSRIAEKAKAYPRKTYPDMEVRVFFRMAGPGYRTEIKRVYEETDRWGADLTNELHFNSFNSDAANGSEVLTSGTASSFKFAQITQNMIVARFGQKDRGVVTRKTGRGSESLMSGSAPAILSEPFFGSSGKDTDRFDEEAEEILLAKIYVDAAAEALEVLPRTNMAESRTIKTTGQQKALAVLGKRSGELGIGSLVLDQAGIAEAIGIGEQIEGALPWVAGGGFVIALLVLYGIPWLADRIEDYRAEDHAKELR